MNHLLQEIYKTQQVLGDDGERVNPFPIATPKATGDVFYKLITSQKLARTLEIGMAYGLSTMFICQAHKDNGGGHHISIDPSQRSLWKSIGLRNIERSNLSEFHALIERCSHEALPPLLEQGQKIDFAYIDGMHVFDYALVDFFYIDRMLRTNGYVAFDDIWMPAIRRLIAYVLSNRSYKRLDITPEVPNLEHLKTVTGRLLRSPLERDVGNLRLVRGNVVLLQKQADDTRPWNFHAQF